MQAASDLRAKLRRWYTVLWLAVWVPASGLSEVVAQASTGSPGPDVQQLAETEFRIQRARVEEARAWLERNNCGYYLPAEKRGRVVGMKVYGIKRGSLAHQVGLRNGDIITQINGASLANAETGMRAHAELLRASRVTVELERENRTMTLLWIADPT